MSRERLPSTGGMGGQPLRESLERKGAPHDRTRGWSRAAPAILAAGAFAYAAILTTLAWLRHDSFQSGRLDLGNMAQAVWNTAHARPLEMSDTAGHTISRLGFHVDPVLALLAPLYRLWPDPKLLLLFQAAFIASGALPAYRIAREELAGLAPPSLAAALAGAYLLYPPLQWAALDDFHPVALAAPLLLFAIWFLRGRRYLPFAVAAVLAMACKEEVGLVVAALGVYAALVWDQRRVGAAVALAGLVWSLVALEVVVPLAGDGGEGPFGSRYDAVGGDAPGILKTAFTDPLRLAGEALSARDLGYMLGLIAPLLALPLLAPVALLVAAPELAVNLLSSQEAQSSWRFHYVAAIAPVLWWASVLGVRRLLSFRTDRRGRWRWAMAVPVAALIAGYVMGPLPWWSGLPGGSARNSDFYAPDGHDRVVERALDRVPEDAAVSATNLVGGHMSNRRRIALFPALGESRYVVADLRNPSIGEANGRGPSQRRRRIARRLRLALRPLRDGPAWRTVFDQDGVIVLARRPAKTRTSTSAR